MTTTTTKQYGVKVVTKNLHYGDESYPIGMWVMRHGTLSLEHYEDPEIRVVEITQQVSHADRHGYVERTHYIDSVWGETWEHPSKVKMNVADYKEKLAKWANLRTEILRRTRLEPSGLTPESFVNEDDGFDLFTVAMLMTKMAYEGLLQEDRNGGRTVEAVYRVNLHGKNTYRQSQTQS
jgi:hypothetical protein